MAISLDPGLSLTIGDHSYIHDHQIFNPSGALTDIEIGKFCSIATELTIIGYDHRSEWITTYPFLDDGHRVNWPGTDGIPYPQSPEFGGNRNRGDIQIGNDVWIGYNVKLFKGVVIGNGAVIGACSLVNKSVAPYSVVAGIPARPIRKRFSDPEIAFLERIRWWDWPSRLINQHLALLCSSDISGLEKVLGPDFVIPEESVSVFTPELSASPGGGEPAAASLVSAEAKTPVDRWLAQADEAYARGDLLSAGQALKSALETEPHAVPLLVCLGNLLFQLNQPAEALGYFKRAAELDPVNSDVQVRLACTAARCNESQLLDAALSRSLQLAPHDPAALRLSANQHLNVRDFARAAEIYCELLPQAPDDTELLTQLGISLHQLGDKLSARWCLERVLAIDPSNESVRETLSRLAANRADRHSTPHPIPVR
jgi:acetyltransferase-like isoleucine patch superfamily enzyme/Flp pilus assembly protein TadD